VSVHTTKIPGSTRSKANKLGFQKLQPPEFVAGCRAPCGARLIHHGAAELLVQQDSVPDRDIMFPLHEGNLHTHPLSSFLPDRSLRGDHVSLFQCSLPNNKLSRPIRLVPRKVLVVGLVKAPSGPCEDNRGALRDVNDHFYFQSTTVEGFGLTPGS
jgi:hypothetical protein